MCQMLPSDAKAAADSAIEAAGFDPADMLDPSKADAVRELIQASDDRRTRTPVLNALLGIITEQKLKAGHPAQTGTPGLPITVAA